MKLSLHFWPVLRDVRNKNWTHRINKYTALARERRGLMTQTIIRNGEELSHETLTYKEIRMIKK
jgi:hypothetical protein